MMMSNLSMIDILTNFTSVTWTMNVLASGTEDITSSSSVALTSLSPTVSNSFYTNQSLTYNICNSDLKITLNNINYEE